MEAPLKAARTLMRVLGIPPEVPILRANVSRQEPESCAWYALHYFEQEWRVGLGEPRGHLGPPSLDERRAMRRTLQSLRSASLTALAKWRKDEEEEARRATVLLERARLNFAAILKRRELWAETLLELKEAARMSREGGRSLVSEPPPLRIRPECESEFVTPKKRRKPAEPTSAGTLWLSGEEPPLRSPVRPEEMSEEEADGAEDVAAPAASSSGVLEARPEAEVRASATAEVGAAVKAAAVAPQPRDEEERRGDEATPEAEVGAPEGAEVSAEVGAATVAAGRGDEGERRGEREGVAMDRRAIEEELPVWVARFMETHLEPTGRETCDLVQAKEKSLQAYVDVLMSRGVGVEVLRPEHAEKVRRVVSNGLSICGKCRWQSGCHECDGRKCLRYWLRKELATEAPRPVGRPKVRAQRG